MREKGGNTPFRLPESRLGLGHFLYPIGLCPRAYRHLPP